jgi:hypothetical protein
VVIQIVVVLPPLVVSDVVPLAPFVVPLVPLVVSSEHAASAAQDVVTSEVMVSDEGPQAAARARARPDTLRSNA